MMEPAKFVSYVPVKKHIVLHVDNFILEFESTDDAIEFICAYTEKRKDVVEEDDN